MIDPVDDESLLFPARARARARAGEGNGGVSSPHTLKWLLVVLALASACAVLLFGLQEADILSVQSKEEGKPHRNEEDTIQQKKTESFTSHAEAGQHRVQKVDEVPAIVVMKKGEASVLIEAVVHQQRLIAGFRNRVALASIQILKEDTEEAVSSGYMKADIGPLVDIIDEAIDAVGVRAVHSQILELYSLSNAWNVIAEAMGIEFRAKPRHPPDKPKQPTRY